MWRRQWKIGEASARNGNGAPSRVGVSAAAAARIATLRASAAARRHRRASSRGSDACCGAPNNAARLARRAPLTRRCGQRRAARAPLMALAAHACICRRRASRRRRKSKQWRRHQRKWRATKHGQKINGNQNSVA